MPEAQTNLRSNARLFAERLNKLSEEKRLQLAQFIVTRCYLVVVATPDLDSAYRIFSVLNSRGLDLSATDILKAEIIGAIAAAQRDTYTRRWEEIEEDLGRDPFGDLFSHIRMVYRKAKPQSTLLKEFKDHVPGLSQPTKFLDTILLPMARAYAEMLGSSYESTTHAEQVNVHLQWLNRLEFTDWVPPALAFMTRHRQEPGRVLNFFRDLERMAYAMLIRKFGINERIERFSRLTAEIEKGQDLYSDASVLQLKPVEQHQVYVRLDGPLYEDLAPRARAAVLLRLDALLSGGGASYEYATVTVEHVLPQQPPSDSQWLTWFPDAKERLQWVHRLGNLALLTRKKNSSASNYDFDTKKRAYFSRNGISPFVLTTQVLDKDEWTSQVLAQRQASLLLRFEEHFRLQNRKSLLDDLESST